MQFSAFRWLLRKNALFEVVFGKMEGCATCPLSCGSVTYVECGVFSSSSCFRNANTEIMFLSTL